MTNSNLKAVLPERDEMMRRLILVHGDDHVIDGLHPYICSRLAGQELAGMGVVNAVLIAVHEYSDGSPILKVLTEDYIPGFIKALVDDEQVRQDALDFFAGFLAAAGREPRGTHA